VRCVCWKCPGSGETRGGRTTKACLQSLQCKYKEQLSPQQRTNPESSQTRASNVKSYCCPKIKGSRAPTRKMGQVRVASNPRTAKRARGALLILLLLLLHTRKKNKVGVRHACCEPPIHSISKVCVFCSRSGGEGGASLSKKIHTKKHLSENHQQSNRHPVDVVDQFYVQDSVQGSCLAAVSKDCPVWFAVLPGKPMQNRTTFKEGGVGVGE